MEPHRLFEFPWPATVLEDTDSTSSEAQRSAAQGEFGPRWIRARTQSGGRGRLGRLWSSPAGNLYTTALFPLMMDLREATRIPFVAGLAVIEAVAGLGVAADRLRLKWPNDVLTTGHEKLAGILVETGGAAKSMWAAVGFGVNVAAAPDLGDRATICLRNLPGGEPLDAADVLTALDVAFRRRMGALLRDGFGPEREEWTRCAAWIGRKVRMSGANGVVTGVLVGIDEDGALILEDGQGRREVLRGGELRLAETD
jgi:BirA family transcriptional regulator, biotin operon repressor / biotin---[acetyl-CoA-carboxylase] ligase